MEKRNTMLLTVVAIATLLVAVVGATFAYFTAMGDTSGRSDVRVITSSHDNTVATGGDVTLTVTAADMTKLAGTSGGTPVGATKDPGSVKLTTTLGSGGGTSVCTYDLVYTPIANGEFTNSTANTSNKPEFVLRIQATAAGANTSISSGYATEEDKDVAGYTSSSPLTLVSNATLTVTGVSSEGSVTWSIRPIIYNYDFIQDPIADDLYGGAVSFENVNCTNTGP